MNRRLGFDVCTGMAAFLLLLWAVGASADPTPPVVSNVSVTVSKNHVEITYDLAQAEGLPCVIWLTLSKDGGLTYQYPVKTVSGDAGKVSPGPNKKIIWNAYVDYPNEDIPQAGIRVNVGGWLGAGLPDNLPSAPVWTKVLSSAPWGASANIEVLEYNGVLVLMHFDTKTIWISADGVSWTQKSTSMPGTTRSPHCCVIKDNQIWLIGGHYYNTTDTFDVCSSYDLVNWTKHADSTAVPTRAWAGLEVINNQFVVWGGLDSAAFQSDSWSSSNGVVWTQVSTGPQLIGLAEQTKTSYKGHLWTFNQPSPYVGGYPNNANGGIYRSTDNGASWTKITPTGSYTPPYATVGAATQSPTNLYVVSGSSCRVSKSEDGLTWTGTSGTWEPRCRFATIWFRGRLWLMGGVTDNDNSNVNDVWCWETN